MPADPAIVDFVFRLTHDLRFLNSYSSCERGTDFAKCDEGHPVCRNCVKSKRECLGYDPVFRPQATAPSAIQPAPNPPPSLVVKPQGAPPQSSLAYPSAPPGYMPASSQPFAPAIQSESPSTSTDVHEHRASVDSSLGNPTQISSNMQNTVDPRPPGFEAPFRGAHLFSDCPWRCPLV